MAVIMPPGVNIHLLDADILIDIQHKRPEALAWFHALDLTAAAVPGFVAMELLQDARNAQEARAVDRLLSLLPRVWPSPAACEAAYADFRALHLSHGLGLADALADALIAATARERGAILCTFNIKHFRAVPNPMTEQPYTR